MAKRGLRYIAQRLKQIAVLSLGSALFFGLCFASLSQAGDGLQPKNQIKSEAATPTKVMQILMTPAGSPIDGCLLPVEIPETKRCKGFFNVDDEEILRNLIHNYTSCLDGHEFYYDFSLQPTIKINDTIKIYGRTIDPLTIKGLKLIPGKDFPKDSPAIAIFGKSVNLKDVHLEGFDTGILYVSEDSAHHNIVGGEISNKGTSDKAILFCHASPIVDGTVFSGYAEKVSIITTQ